MEQDMTKEALRLALEALSEAHYVVEHRQDVKKREQAITAIKEALANEALDKMAENARELGLDYEPVAWNTGIPSLHPKMKEGETISVEYVELTPPQRPWVGLTDEEVKNFVQAVWPREATPTDYIRAIEAKLRSKNS
jgi:hypothetical protein